MMRSIQKNKRLAAMVSMALTIGAVWGMASEDALAAEYTGDYASGKMLAAAPASNTVTVTDGNTLDLSQHSGTIDVIANGNVIIKGKGAAIGNLTLADNALVKNSGLDDITVDTIEFGNGATIATVNRGNFSVRNLVSVASGKTVTLGSNVQLKNGLNIAVDAVVNVVADRRITVIDGNIAGAGALQLGDDAWLMIEGNNSNALAGTITLGGNAKLESASSLSVGGIKAAAGSYIRVWYGGTLTINNAASDPFTARDVIIEADGIESRGSMDLSGAELVEVTSVKAGGDVTLDGLQFSYGHYNITSVKGANIKLNNAVTAVAGTTLDAGTGTITAANGLDLKDAGSITAGTIQVNNGTFTPPAAANLAGVGTVRLTGNAALGAGSTGSVDLGNAALVVETGSSGVGAGVKDITASAVTLAKDVTIASPLKITSNELHLDASDSAALNKQISNLESNLKMSPNTSSEVIVYVTDYDKLPLEKQDALAAALQVITGGRFKIVGVAPPSSGGTADSVMDEIKAAAGDEAADLVTANPEVIANADPFVSKLPSADALAKLEALGNVNGEDLVKKYYEAVKANGGDVSNLSPDARTQAARLTAAVQQAGKTAAAPGITSARTATAITTVLRDNVVNRNAEIRDFEAGAAAAVDEGRPAPDRVWFQYKHTNMDVDGDVYNESNVNTNTFQLGYDAKVGRDDYLGAFVGTTTGDAEFNGPRRSGRMNIDGSFDVGIYGTHLLPREQYIDYMLHTSRFDSEYGSSKWGTMDTGIMVGYGVKIAHSDRLTLNPYIQLAYDRIDVDSYWAGPNYITNDASDNWTAKLGINVIDASGFYGGLAYSRGLSGSYNAYINGVPMPGSDYNANVLYLSLGYRADMSKNAVIDLSLEKTFMDYDGWTASGKVNFYF